MTPQHVTPAGAAALALLSGVLVHYAPEHLAEHTGGLVTAWETVCYGLEAALLWAAVGLLVAARWPVWVVSMPTAAVCALMAWEGGQRALCRPMFPMDRPLRLQEPACVVALGDWAAWIGYAGAAAAAAAVAWGASRGR